MATHSSSAASSRFPRNASVSSVSQAPAGLYDKDSYSWGRGRITVLAVAFLAESLRCFGTAGDGTGLLRHVQPLELRHSLKRT